MTPNTILNELRRHCGTQFDPAVVNAFERILEQRGESLIVNSAQAVTTRPSDLVRDQWPTFQSRAPILNSARSAALSGAD